MYFTEKDILFFYAETSLHPGSGGGTGLLDLPVQRESCTGLPMFAASGIKGAVREFFRHQVNDQNKIQNEIHTVFGPEPGQGASEHAGAMTISDARILLFPIRSLYGVFAYLTCPLVLQRLRRDLEIVGWTANDINRVLPAVEVSGNDLLVIQTPDSEKTFIADFTENTGEAVLEDYFFKAFPEQKVNTIADFLRRQIFPSGGAYDSYSRKFPSRFAIVSDDVFSDFTHFCTEVITRNRVDDVTGTVADNALFTEEHIPAESVMYSLLLCCRPFKPSRINDAKGVQDLIKKGSIPQNTLLLGLNNQRLQIGGDQTVGHGFIFSRFLEKQGEKSG